MLARDYLDNLPERIPLLFADVPHFPWDLMLAKEASAKGSPVFCLRPTQLENRIAISVGDEFHKPVFLKCVPDVERWPVDIFKRSGRLALAMSNNTQASKSRQMSFHAALRWNARATASTVLPPSILRRLRLRPFNGSYWSIYSEKQIARRFLQQQGMQKVLQREYSSLASDVLPDQFIYFPLHYQPERTTDPEVGLFSNQLDAVRFLRQTLQKTDGACLPIVVKEHPRQLAVNPSDIRQSAFRSKEFYQNLLEIDNVKIASLDLDSQLLIEKSLATVTPNGSSAWEALLAGRPSATLVTTWHTKCKASPSLESGMSVELDRILRLSANEVIDCLRRFEETEDLTFTGATQANHLRERSSISRIARVMKANIALIMGSQLCQY
jgi:hypothetical protein